MCLTEKLVTDKEVKTVGDKCPYLYTFMPLHNRGHNSDTSLPVAQLQM